MEIFSLSFIYLFLPATIAVFYFTPQKLKSGMLVLFSLLFYWMLERENILLLLSSVTFDYLMARLIEKSKEQKNLQRAPALCSVIKSLGLIVIYSLLSQYREIPFPWGLAVYSLISTGYVLDCYRGVVFCDHNITHLLALCCFYPQLYAGPLVSYNRQIPQIKRLRMSMTKMGEGAGLFILGLGKKIIIGDNVIALYTRLRSVPYYEATTLTVWSMILALAFSAYFILSGFCDMAKGIGLMFGMEVPDNFNYPYRAKSVNEFLARFNITINRYIRRYVYVNLGGAKGGMISGMFNILVASMLMALWFGINLNYLIWGAFLGFFVILERYWLKQYLDVLPGLFSWLYTITVVIVSFVFFAGGSLSESWNYIRIMFSIGDSALYNNDIIYQLSSNYLVLIVAAVYSTGIFNRLSGVIKRHLPRVWHLSTAVMNIALLILVTAFLL